VKRSIAWFAALTAAIVVWRMLSPNSEIAIQVVFGWFAFLRRSAVRLTIRWDGVAMFGGALALFVVLSHFFLRWLYRETQRDDSSAVSPWRLRWTLSLTTLTVLAFAAGIAMIGATHQVAWLARSDEPLFGPALADSLSSENNLKLQGLAIQNSHDTYKSFPRNGRMVVGTGRHNWIVGTLPFLGYSSADIDLNRDWDDPANAGPFKSLLPPLLNPDFRTVRLRNQAGYGLSHYAGSSHIFDHDSGLRFEEVTDGSTNTLLVGEINSNFPAWGDPANTRDPSLGLGVPDGFGGASEAVVLFLNVDGSIRLIDADIDPVVLHALATPAADD